MDRDPARYLAWAMDAAMKKLGQINLFTKRVTTKAPAPIERQVHILLADTLRWSISPGWVWFHCPNGELRNDATGALLKRMGVLPGVSDFILIGPPHGRVHVLELKRKGRKPNNDQELFMAAVTMTGGAAAWADNSKDAIEILKGWGALTTRLQFD